MSQAAEPNPPIRFRLTVFCEITLRSTRSLATRVRSWPRLRNFRRVLAGRSLPAPSRISSLRAHLTRHGNIAGLRTAACATSRLASFRCSSVAHRGAAARRLCATRCAKSGARRAWLQRSALGLSQAPSYLRSTQGSSAAARISPRSGLGRRRSAHVGCRASPRLACARAVRRHDLRPHGCFTRVRAHRALVDQVLALAAAPARMLPRVHGLLVKRRGPGLGD